MADRRVLHKDKLEEFKSYLQSIGVAYRAGRGEYQALQVLTNNKGWQCIYNKLDMPEHLTIQDTLKPLVKRFLTEVKNV